MLTPLKAHRAQCLRCTGNSRRLVRECPATDCPSWFFRMGRNPNLIGKRARGRPFKRGQSKITPPSVESYEANSPEAGDKSG